LAGNPLTEPTDTKGATVTATNVHTDTVHTDTGPAVVAYADVDRLTVKDAVTILGRLAGGRRVVPILENVEVSANVYRQTVDLTATDLATVVRVTVPAEVTVGGRFLVDRRALAGTVKAGGDRVTFEASSEGDLGFGTVTFATGGVTIDNRTGILADWPTLPAWPAPTGRVDGVQFSRVGAVASVASSDEGRPVLTGVRFRDRSDVFGPHTYGQLEVAATDSYALAVTPVGVDGHVGAGLVPADTVRKVARLGADTVDIGSVEDVRTGRYGGTTGRFGFYLTVAKGPKRARRELAVAVSVETVEGAYPNYPTLMPAAHPADGWVVTADRDELAAAAGTIADVVKGNGNVPAIFNPDGETVSATVDGQTVSVPVPMSVYPGGEREGGPVPVAFNPAYLARTLATFEPGTVWLHFRDALKPARIDQNRTGQPMLGLLMPMRVH
jgi:DNA polymerase III sliding clamp (beta) subunit (PCNA family)